MVFVPSWLKAPDVAQDYESGVQTGTQIALAQQRLAAEDRRSQMEMQIEQQRTQRATALKQAELQTQAAYHQQQNLLKQQQLDQVAKVNAAKTKAAADAMAESTALAKEIQSGVPIDEAMYRHPNASKPFVDHILARQKADQLKDYYDSRLGIEQQQADTASFKAHKPTEITVSEHVPKVESADAIPASNGIFGMGAHPAVPAVAAVNPTTITRHVPSGDNPLGVPPPIADAQDEMISVKNPAGKTGKIPRSKLAAAIKAGYAPVESVKTVPASTDDTEDTEQ